MKNVFTPEQQKRRLELNYPQLFPLNADTRDLTMVVNNLKGKDFTKFSLVISPYDWMRPTFLYMFMSLGKYVSSKICNAYEFLDIYLGNSEEYQSIAEIEVDVIATYLGYGEFENKRQEDILLQLINYQKARNKNFWLFFKGSEHQFAARYPALYALFKEYNIIEMSKSKSGVISEDVL